MRLTQLMSAIKVINNGHLMVPLNRGMIRDRRAMTEKFVAKTVIVRNGDVDGAFQVLNRIMGVEGLFDIFRRTRRYEKGFNTRRRVNWTMCKAVYDEDMDRKIKFLMRKNRVEPFPCFVDNDITIDREIRLKNKGNKNKRVPPVYVKGKADFVFVYPPPSEDDNPYLYLDQKD